MIVNMNKWEKKFLHFIDTPQLLIYHTEWEMMAGGQVRAPRVSGYQMSGDIADGSCAVIMVSQCDKLRVRCPALTGQSR